jgi:hypothetical protein
LFRLIEIEEGGSIEIDGVDIRSISLQKLEILCHNPSGIRTSLLDPLRTSDATGKASPEDMWSRQPHRPDEGAIQNPANGLDTQHQ